MTKQENLASVAIIVFFILLAGFVVGWAQTEDEEDWVFEGDCVTHIYETNLFFFKDGGTTITRYCKEE